MKKLFYYSFILLSLISATQLVHAQSKPATYTLLEPLPCIEGTGNDCKKDEVITKISIDQYIAYVFKFAIALSVFLAVVVIIYGGFEVMISEIPSVKVAGKSRIYNAVFGLLAALCSYLILQTIDPRLVQINTNIEPICNEKNSKEGGLCDRNAVINFTASYQEKLKNLSKEKQVESLQYQLKIEALDKKKAELEGKYNEGKMTEEEYELYKVELVNIATEKADLKAKQAAAIYEGVGVVLYSQAYQAIYDPIGDAQKAIAPFAAAPTKSGYVNGKLPVNGDNKIESDFNRQINEVNAITPQTTETTNLVRRLGHQKDFYIAQVKEELEVAGKIKTNTDFRGGGGAGGGYVTVIKNTNSVWLEAKVKEYEAKIADPQTQFTTDTGLPAFIYKDMLRTRINIMKEELNRNAKK